jgi:SAM-dependent methyltransferase
MHDTAYEIGGAFIREYSKNHPCIVVEIGSMDFNGSLREHIDANDVYLGLDVEHGKNVDLVIDPLKPLPLRDGFADIVLSSSQMEHDKFFWKTFIELVRITKDNGYIYVSAPSNGDYHSYPIDCWRFYPEAGLALAEWATINGLPCALIESFTAGRKADYWNDYVAIFQKCPPEQAVAGKPISDGFTAYNVRRAGSDEVANKTQRTEDFRLTADARQRLAEAQDEIRELTRRIHALEQELAAAKARDVAEHPVVEAVE